MVVSKIIELYSNQWLLKVRIIPIGRSEHVFVSVFKLSVYPMRKAYC